MNSRQPPKYLQVADDIEQRLQAGTWARGRLPSVRCVAEDHGVSVVTASRALQVLRDKGLIDSVQRAGAFVRPGAAADEAGYWALEMRLTRVPQMPATEAVVRRGFDRLAADGRAEVRPNPFNLPPKVSVREVQRRLAGLQHDGLLGVFLLPSRTGEEESTVDERLVRACRLERVPVVLLERNLRGEGRPLENDLVALDDTAAGAECGRHLIETGRRRLGMVLGSPVSSHLDRAAGFLLAIHRAREAGTAGLADPVTLWQREGDTLKEACRRLADGVTAAGLDGVVCYNDYTAMGLAFELMSRGRRVPDDVALVGFDDLQIGQEFAVRLTTYSYPSEGLAETALHRIRLRAAAPEADPVKVCVRGKLIVRESTGLGSHEPGR